MKSQGDHDFNIDVDAFYLVCCIGMPSCGCFLLG